ncbi:MAG TPA: peptidylprolyl isomerase [Algoriphagus sp.]|jgi:FKBP-type peptidyl-prolyl cis-trans isomerase FklB|uniref:FKBP-type peptidyl-prolyl cis-trans isomerase n=1 Tax=unclassified Algoriphagus TaxID=2641541 RepID=UPI000C6B8FCE|nr:MULTISPECIES: FKBP-type peptidyl-prolyl cis-trans isomerase [unclassified Algoriphagus]MAL15288.1 peptidylprolyl isomerase [Algoriphagus sp.]MAN87454.1 peptidylprolyl isomerase [Algoriphagus sp.]QYH40715.1 FKBP-type peptidyl-prolyl cis-trans isomerase [Algoriphagus sp. NBT04N3]HAD53019.1 peptidylprolyl isomerase [Algoriphagus sp.]HAS57518.1 peptidylprolyl isomerase [Algoriphagus sp.]|tara:strand:+ start:8022 stop:8585 length:564 start_codon:yes stop_codon:yes gene_type:complete
MKLRLTSLLLILASGFAMMACIDPDSTYQAILERDKKAIEEYLAANPLTGPKDFVDELTGFTVIWQQLSNSGRMVAPGDTVRVNYTGKFLNNKVFDTTIETVARANNIYTENRQYGPIRYVQGGGIRIRQLIEGFETAVAIMEVGDKATVLMPSAFAYGPEGRDNIPPNTPLIFEIEFVELKKGPQN